MQNSQGKPKKLLFFFWLPVLSGSVLGLKNTTFAPETDRSNGIEALQIAARNLSRNPSFIHRVFSSSSASNDADNNNFKLPSLPSPISFQEFKVSFDAIRESLKQRDRSLKQRESSSSTGAARPWRCPLSTLGGRD
ncbi:hypothetical protein CK203_071013 [Vitis vinifera]|uniref:Uncharacterized protein n=1 Tax=Vitis vinifera TaxID=29760 RepID=A0A438E9T1_VITVI|nr:hypothetical protein CK203_071013 [Vitis vinifera]